MLIKFLESCLKEPKTLDLDIDSPETTLLRSQIIRNKYFLKKIYEEWYHSISRALPAHISGPVLELGSGGGFLKTFMPDLITSDIFYLPHIDIVLEGQTLPFDISSLQCVVMLDVLHHLPQVESFFAEAARCVIPGGNMVMIEPWNTRWSQMIFKYLHHEPFDPNVKKWSFPKGGPLSQANSALPWIVFKRDRAQFENIFPEWQIKEIVLHTPFRYLISGGVSFKCFMPGYSFPLWTRFEALLNPWMHTWAMFARIVLTRKD